MKIPAAMKRALTATADKENMTTSELVRAMLTKSLKVLFIRLGGIWIELIGINRLYFAGLFKPEVDPSDSRKE